MKKLLYVLLVFVVLGVGMGTGWYICDVLNSRAVPPQDGTGIRLTMVLDDIDYSAFADLMTGKIGAEKAADVLSSAGKAVLGLLPQETKDKLVVYLINENREDLNRAAQEILAEYGFPVKIDLSAENLEESSGENG